MDKEIEGIVEIGSKPIVERRATATGILNLSQNSAEAIQNKSVKKGDVLEASTIAAIQAVKDTPRIVPHCHPIPLEGIHFAAQLKYRHITKQESKWKHSPV
jgi:cyclic pyranopterin phosphate synthase